MALRRRTVERAAAQARVIAALTATGDSQDARPLQRCMAAMTSRRQGGGWPPACRGSGCIWCGPSLARRWWRALREWIVRDDAPVSLAILPLHHRPGGLRSAVARLRRGCRDVRDRAARRQASGSPLRPTPWRAVEMAGMATGSGSAHVLVRHPGVPRREVARVLAARWPDAVVCGADGAEPSWSFAVEDAAELARIRRGVEPLRIVVPEQRGAMTSRSGTDRVPTAIEPMPVVF